MTPQKDVVMHGNSPNTPTAIASGRTFTIVGGKKQKIMGLLESMGGILSMKEGENWVVISFLSDEPRVWDLDGLIIDGQCVVVKPGDIFGDLTNEQPGTRFSPSKTPNFQSPANGSSSRSSVAHTSPLSPLYGKSNPSPLGIKIKQEASSLTFQSERNQKGVFFAVDEMTVLSEVDVTNLAQAENTTERDVEMPKSSFANKEPQGFSSAIGRKNLNLHGEEVVQPQSWISRFSDYVFGW